MDREDKLHIGCLFVLVAYAIFGIVSCFRSETKQEGKHTAYTMSDEEKYIADSIAYEKRLKEIKEAEEQERLRKEKEERENTYTLAIISKHDNIYHTTTKCEELMSNNSEGFSLYEYRLITIHNAKSKGYEICSWCEEREETLRKYEDREIVDYEDVPLIATEEFNMTSQEDDEDEELDWEDRDYYEIY